MFFKKQKLRARKWKIILGEEQDELLGSKRDKALEIESLNDVCDVIF